MKITLLTVLLLFFAGYVTGQVTFKSGWNTYKTGLVTHEYTYSMNFGDSIKLGLVDSILTFASTDSLVIMAMHFPLQEKCVYKTTCFLNPKKQIVKKEEFRDDNMQKITEWRYDEKNRKIAQYEDNKDNGNNIRKTYEYSTDKKNGEFVVTENSYFNGKIEFYTKTYFDKKNVRLKEIRLNDNNKDIMHIETYAYGENGKVKERTDYFPEWKVTKKFEEKEGNEIAKCYKTLPVGTAERIFLDRRVDFIKKLISRNKLLLSDKDCHDFEYTFTNFANCDVIIANTNINNGKKVTFIFKEKL